VDFCNKTDEPQVVRSAV